MKKNWKFLAVIAIGLAGCSSSFKDAGGGTLYKIVDDKSGENIKEGDFISVQYNIKTDGDSLLSSTYEIGHPQILLMPKIAFKGDLPTALTMLSEGDSAIVKANIDTMIKKSPGQQKPPFKSKYIVYYLRIEKVIKKGSMTDAAFQDKVKVYLKDIADKTKAAEPVRIKKYIETNKLNVTKTPSGLYYAITTPGTGPVMAVGDTAVISYVGKFTTGKVFETNIKEEALKNKALYQPMNPYKPARFAVGVKQVIPGWDEGLLLLNKGAKATLVIPYSLAYGEQGGGPIPPYTPLVFDIQVIDIIHPNPNAPKAPMPVMPPPATTAPQAKK